MKRSIILLSMILALTLLTRQAKAYSVEVIEFSPSRLHFFVDWTSPFGIGSLETAYSYPGSPGIGEIHVETQPFDTAVTDRTIKISTSVPDIFLLHIDPVTLEFISIDGFEGQAFQLAAGGMSARFNYGAPVPDDETTLGMLALTAIGLWTLRRKSVVQRI